MLSDACGRISPMPPRTNGWTGPSGTPEQVAHEREHRVVAFRGFAEEVLCVGEINLQAGAANGADRHAEVAVLLLAIPQADAVR